MRRLVDAVARSLARLVLRVFYQEIETLGLEKVPQQGPVLFVANHGNGLVDPVALVALLPQMPRFLAKHTLWRNPAVLPILALGGAVPIYRAQEGDTSRNEATFARCFDELEAGGAIALFPEGMSHDEPSLQPLRTGAARIARGASDRIGAPVPIVPVGLTFDAKPRFRSRLLLSAGEPIEPPLEVRGDEVAEVHGLTEQIDAALRAVTLNVGSWEDARVVERVAELFDGESTRPLPGRASLGERFSLRRELGERYEAVRATHAAEVEAIEAMAWRYGGMLEALRLRDDHVTARYPWRSALGYVGYRLPVLLALLPVAAVGTLLNYLPYRGAGWVSAWGDQRRDQPATYKFVAGLLLFPFTWALEIGAAGLWWGATAALATALGAPVSGWIALRFAERNLSFWRELRAWFVLRLAPERAATLRSLRATMRERVLALVDETSPREGQVSGSGPPRT